MTTDACKTRHGLMSLNGKVKAGRATIEHVWPRCEKAPGEPHLIMLACGQCNVAKGREFPSPQVIALAMKLHDEWVAHALAKALEKSGPKYRRVGDLKPLAR